jgi:DNA-binding transcriptional regulator YdaS (Cro superfamily)
MTKQQAIDHYGSAANLARALGISRGAVTNWGDKIPPSRQWEIEVLTEGALRAERPNGQRAA